MKRFRCSLSTPLVDIGGNRGISHKHQTLISYHSCQVVEGVEAFNLSVVLQEHS